MPVITTLHKVASPVLYKSGLYQRMWRARNKKQPFTFVVFYHRVVADELADAEGFDIESGISATDFERQMRFLVQHFSPVKASQAQHVSSSKIQFSVTLDDGYEDNYLVAAPILKRLGIPATFYVVSDFVDTDRLFWWEQVADIMHKTSLPELDLQAVLPGHNLSELAGSNLDCSGRPLPVLPLDTAANRDFAFGQLCSYIRHGLHRDIPAHLDRIADYFSIPVREQGRQYGLMNWQQLNELVQQGFEIGGHTASHCNVIGADEELLKLELIDSINVLEDHLDTAVESFAYPYGLFEKSSKAVADVLSQTNCKAAYTIVQGVVMADMPAYELPRTKLNRAYEFACAFNVQDTLINTKDG
jgi:peptidoglycan/xylan/chitin deacetylase (PgdA/CDA1 family)